MDEEEAELKRLFPDHYNLSPNRGGDWKFGKNALATFGGIVILCCTVFLCLFIKESCNYLKKNLGKQDLSRYGVNGVD